MKFSLKLVLCIIVIMACILSCSRFFIIRQSFRHSIEKSANQNSNQNIAQRYYIESNIVKNIQQGEEITNDKVIEYIKSLYSYIGENSEKIALYDDKKNIIFSNFEKTKDMNINLTKETDNYYIRNVEDKYYMLFSSYLTINNDVIYIINIYDITDLYQERDRQIKEILIVDIIILGIASIFIIIFSKLLTRHINKLNIISKKIAKGEFSNRVSIKSKDEIGELANSFNIMSEEIENKINSLNLVIKQKNDFINGFTHEIKTPMTAIIGYSDMLRLRKCDKELTKKALNYIYNEAKRLEKLSYKLMDLMYLTENNVELEIIEIDNFIDKISSKISNLEDLKMENTSYKKKPVDSKIDVQAESIYLIKAIHDIQDGSSNLKISNHYSEIALVVNTKEDNNKIIKYLIEETKKMQINDNELEHLLEKYEDTNFKYYIYAKEYNTSENEYKIYRIVFQIDNYEMFVEIEEKTCKILSYVGIPRDNAEGISIEQVLRNYVRYLGLYIIDDWTYKNNMLVSEKSKLAANIVHYDKKYIISIHSLTNEYILDVLKMD